MARDAHPRVLAIDGPSGSGKSSVSRSVATALGYGYLDTGATYRAITWQVLRAGTTAEELAADQPALVALLEATQLVLSTDPGDPSVVIDDRDVTRAIRDAEVTGAVSAVSALPVVRQRMTLLQRRLALGAAELLGGVVVEGCDIGTAVFPDAPLKVWLTAQAEVRGQRRAAELGDVAAADATAEELQRRDALDASRSLSPLLRAPDAVDVDSTSLDLDMVIATVLGLWQDAMAVAG